MSLHDPLPDGGLIRKMWIGEADAIPRPSAAARPGEPRTAGSAAACRTTYIRNYVDTIDVARRRRARLLRRRHAARRGRTAPDRRTPVQAGRGRLQRREADWQSHGVGSALLERTLLTARNRGIAHLHMACLADNRRMQQLARKFDAELSFDFGEVVGEVDAAASDAAVGGARDGRRTARASQPRSWMRNPGC